MRILVASAPSVARTIVVRTSELLGHEVSVCTNGDEAWRHITSRPVDTVICDAALPGLDAISLCQRLRAHGPGDYVYFVMLSPLGASHAAVASIRHGVDDVLGHPVERQTLEARLLVAKRVVSLHRQLYSQARSDALTRVGNRLRFVEDMRVVEDRAMRYRESFAVCVCDIDNFKRFNDTYGHLAGDQALVGVARALADNLRPSDAVYRFGGEEFLVLLPQQSLEDARTSVDRLRRRVSELGIAHVGNAPWNRLTLSMGVAVKGPDDTRHLDEVLREADNALYAAKKAGRNCVMAHGDHQPLRLLEPEQGNAPGDFRWSAP
jgi:two-component system chemotaxis response regulator CheY